MKQNCTHCGMIANVDPWTHAERYGHQPRITRDINPHGSQPVLIELEHDGAGRFTRLVSPPAELAQILLNGSAIDSVEDLPGGSDPDFEFETNRDQITTLFISVMKLKGITP